MRKRIIQEIVHWDEQWQANSHVGSEDCARKVLASLNSLVDAGIMTNFEAVSILMAASNYITTGERAELNKLIEQIPG